MINLKWMIWNDFAQAWNADADHRNAWTKNVKRARVFETCSEAEAEIRKFAARQVWGLEARAARNDVT